MSLSITELLSESLTDPRAATRRIIGLGLSTTTLWQTLFVAMSVTVLAAPRLREEPTCVPYSLHEIHAEPHIWRFHWHFYFPPTWPFQRISWKYPHNISISRSTRESWS